MNRTLTGIFNIGGGICDTALSMVNANNKQLINSAEDFTMGIIKIGTGAGQLGYGMFTLLGMFLQININVANFVYQYTT